MFVGSDVNGKTLGIIGLGRIGRALVKRAQGFDMKVIYYDMMRDKGQEEKLSVRYAPMETVLEQADYVSIHVPLTDSTRQMISDEELTMMKERAYLINTSRGPVVDEDALYRALRDGTIAGAALDVFEEEPINHSSPLLGLDNIIMTPHIASASVETRIKMATTAAENLVSVLKGVEPPNLVNPGVRKVRPLCS